MDLEESTRLVENQQADTSSPLDQPHQPTVHTRVAAVQEEDDELLEMQLRLVALESTLKGDAASKTSPSPQPEDGELLAITSPPPEIKSPSPSKPTFGSSLASTEVPTIPSKRKSPKRAVGGGKAVNAAKRKMRKGRAVRKRLSSQSVARDSTHTTNRKRAILGKQEQRRNQLNVWQQKQREKILRQVDVTKIKRHWTLFLSVNLANP